MSDNIQFNYNSPRCQKARISVRFSPILLRILSILAVILLVLGYVLIFCHISIGWLLAGFAVVPAMMVEWYKGELKHLPVEKNPTTIDDILSGEVLGRLSQKPTPKEVATIVGSLGGGYFFASRFGIGAQFLQEIASENPDDMPTVWSAAWKLYENTKSRNVSAVVLAVALISCNPNGVALLNRLQLDLDAVIDGVDWFNYLRSLVEQHRKPVKTGGIARDWSFGWTPLLNHFGQNVSQQVGARSQEMIELTAHGDSLDQLINIFSKQGRQNAILVGPLGSGKTEVVNAFASRLLDASSALPSSLKFRQVFILDAAALIAVAPDRGGLERLLPQILNEAYSAKNIILCLDNAQLFFEEGVGSVDISNVLLPIIKAGNLRMILTMSEQQYLEISQRNPEIMNLLNRIVVEPATHSETITIMQDQAIILEYQNKVVFMYQALQEAYRLSERYVPDLAMPGRALKVMESAVHYAQNGLVTVDSIHRSLEKTMDIKIDSADTDDERQKLLNLEGLIHERLINQKRAVGVVSDAIRRSKTGVRNQNRPVGTFLFLGPTGVGKTELAKALAAICFNGEDRLIRLDMNEFVRSNDVARLIADGSHNANSLTAQIMKQPFSVVLLDEIEKAHPSVLSTLLQLLDEGILRDEHNREISFRDAIIIATSNAGSDRIREYIERGYDVAQFEDQFVDELINSRQFAPEFLNRFDEIVVFRPLTKEELLKVVNLILIGINKTMAVQKITVSISDEAKKYLVNAGYDPRLGARPMRRVVQRAVESTVAKLLLSGEAGSGSSIEISLEQVQKVIGEKN